MQSSGSPISNGMKKLLVGLSTFGALVLHAMELTVSPPSRYPDLYPALFSIYGAANLMVFYFIFLAWLYKLRNMNDSGDKKLN